MVAVRCRVILLSATRTRLSHPILPLNDCTRGPYPIQPPNLSNRLRHRRIFRIAENSSLRLPAFGFAGGYWNPACLARLSSRALCTTDIDSTEMEENGEGQSVLTQFEEYARILDDQVRTNRLVQSAFHVLCSISIANSQG